LVISFAEQIARHEEASEVAAAEAEYAERHHNGDLQQQLAHVTALRDEQSRVSKKIPGQEKGQGSRLSA
jgi:hypothetical protein